MDFPRVPVSRHGSTQPERSRLDHVVLYDVTPAPRHGVPVRVAFKPGIYYTCAIAKT